MIEKYFLYCLTVDGIRCYQSFDSFDVLLEFLGNYYQQITSVGSDFIQIGIDTHFEKGYYV